MWSGRSWRNPEERPDRLRARGPGGAKEAARIAQGGTAYQLRSIGARWWWAMPALAEEAPLDDDPFGPSLALEEGVEAAAVPGPQPDGVGPGQHARGADAPGDGEPPPADGQRRGGA